MINSPVLLRPLVIDDLPELVGWGDDDEFVRAAEWGPGPADRRRRSWRRLLDQPPADLIRLGVVYAGELVGYVDLHGTATDLELGFVIRSASWGRGLGTSAAAAALDRAFEVHGAHRVWAEAWADNPRSLAVLRRIGMTHIGTGESGTYLGAQTHYEQFALDRTAWESRRDC